MRRLAIVAIASLALVGASFAVVQAAASVEAKVIISFQTMYGVDGPFVAKGPQARSIRVRGVVGDDLPWEITQPTEGVLETNGHLTISVRGLVFKDDPSVPPELRGKNDEEKFRGLVSCLTEEGDRVVTKNVITQGFRATEEGNSFIDAQLELPNPCVAPIVMVLAGSEDKWFSMTGFEAEED